MITLINYASGEVHLRSENGETVRLPRDAANRLIMAARMHGPQDFLDKLASLLPQGNLVQEIRQEFSGKNSSEIWNLKEKFARLSTTTKDYRSPDPGAVIETVL